jgi:hypothetical protein
VTQARVLANGRTLEARAVTATEGRLGVLLPETLGAGPANSSSPSLKVSWRLRFTVKQEHVALANHAIVSEEPLPGGLKRVTFAESRPMPSYLVRWCPTSGAPWGRGRE